MTNIFFSLQLITPAIRSRNAQFFQHNGFLAKTKHVPLCAALSATRKNKGGNVQI